MTRLGRIIIADDEETFLESTADLLREEGYECDCAMTGQNAIEWLHKKQYDLLIADIKMPGNGEMELIKELPKITEGLMAILVTGYPSLETAILATRLSVAGYLTKPVNFDNLLELVHQSVARAQAFRRFNNEAGAQHHFPAKPETTNALKHSFPASSRKPAKDLSQDEFAGWAAAAPVVLHEAKGQQAAEHPRDQLFEEILGQSKAMQHVVDIIKKAALTDSNVLIVGETGTGKELVARAIHRRSLRKNAEFVPVDCVALPPNLIESEMFGYEKGAFTGATGSKHGLLEFADQGTLFLDEISELELNLQAKLLRVLQEREFRRIGGTKLIEVDIRVVAAMNRNPMQALADGHLRRDLFYRLNVIPIRVPPLRHRREDIPFLVNYFLNQANEESNLAPKQISANAMEMLQNYSWPGNVRQLKNVIERLTSLSPGPIINVEDLPFHDDAGSFMQRVSVFDIPFNEAKKMRLESFEKKYLHKLLKAADNDITKAAKMAGISVRTIYRMLNRYGK